MSQQWEHQCVQVYIGPAELGLPEDKVSAVLADWSAQGWELVNGSVASLSTIYLFFRRAAEMG